MEEEDMRKTVDTLSSRVKIMAASICLLVCLGAARDAQADEFAYMITGPTPQFGYVDLNTGVFTQIASLSVTLGGIAVNKGKLYGYGVGSGTLYEINPQSGALTTIGTTSFGYRGLGSTANKLYGFDRSMNLYSVNPATGATTYIGSTGLPNPGGLGVSDGLGMLYIGAGDPPDNCPGSFHPTLYKVNTTTGLATKVNCMTGTTTPGGGFAFQDGILYQSANFPSAIYKINPKTGDAKFVANVTGTTQNLYGLAPAAQVEP